MMDKIDLDVPFYTNLFLGKCIGFGGKLGSGKTFISECMIEYIKSEVDIPIVRRSFADGLRDFVEEEIGIPVKQYKHSEILVDDALRSHCRLLLYSHLKTGNFEFDNAFIEKRLEECAVLNDIYRFVLQYIGTEIYRMQVDMDYWVNLLGQNLESDKITIIDDIRFVNELDVVKNNGISVYSIVLNAPPTSVVDLVENHASETSIGASDFEVMFYNLIGTERLNLGKAAFNLLSSYYYLFKCMKDEPNKEKLLRNTIKNA